MARIQIDDLPVTSEPAPQAQPAAANTANPKVRSGIRSGGSIATAGIRG